LEEAFMSSQAQPGPVWKPCPECGGRRVEVQDNMRGYGGNAYAMYLTQNARSTSFWKKEKSNRSETLTLTCIQCGYTAWYALQPLNLVPDEK
jgi:predicted nucleic-acid-binding Zn-ribbon protein